MCRRHTVLLALLAACDTPIDTTRQPVDVGSFGLTVYTLVCKRVAWTSDLASGAATHDVSGSLYSAFCRSGTSPPPAPFPTVRALAAGRPDLIAAVDETFPSAYLPDLQDFLSSDGFLPLYDDGTAEQAAGKLAALFGLMAGDKDFTAAMARLDARPGFRPPDAQSGALRQVSAYPALDGLLVTLPATLGPGGPAHDAFSKLALAVARELVDAQPVAVRADPERTLNLAVGLLLTESPYLGTNQPTWLARRDADGEAQVATAVTPPPTPFPLSWKADATPRDAAGRALTAGGDLVYRYVDLDRTVLAALAHDLPDLVDPLRGTALDLVRGAAALLGPRVAATKTFTTGASLSYRGFDPANAALLDLVYGYVDLLGEPGFDEKVDVLEALVRDHEPEAARLLEAVFDAVDVAKGFPAAQLVPGSPLYDDLMSIVVQILEEPGLAEDVLRALEDPATRALGKGFADLMRYDDAITIDPDTHEVVGALVTPVDRGQADSGFNRSALQRILHLLADSSGWRLCNKQGAIITFFGFPTTFPYAECDLLEIDDLAVFYAQSIAYAKDAAGNVRHDSHGRPMSKAELVLKNLPFYLKPFVTDDLMESQSTIVGFRSHPTPEGLNRVLFLDPTPDFLAAAMDPPVCKDGDEYRFAHAGTLPALEVVGFYDEIRPVLQAFADHDREDLFVQALVVLHDHWPSRSSAEHQFTDPDGHGYAWSSDIHAYEPLVIQLLDGGDLWPALTEGAPVIDAIQAGSGRAAPEVLADAARFVFEPDPELANRAGRHTTSTEDGRLVPELSPWYVLADAYKAKRAQLAAAGAEGARWNGAVSQLVDLLARGEAAGGTWRFRNPRFRGVALALLEHLRGRVAAHGAAGDLDGWLHTELPGDVQRLLTGPVFAAAADFVVALPADARAAIEGLLVYLNTAGTDAYRSTVTMTADLLQWYADDPDLVPLTRLAGKALDPATGILDAQLTFVQRARAADGKKTLARLLAQIDREATPGRTLLAQIIDSIAEVDRQRPFADLGQPLADADYASVFKTVQTFLDDEKRGLARFMLIVANRHAE